MAGSSFPETGGREFVMAEVSGWNDLEACVRGTQRHSSERSRNSGVCDEGAGEPAT